VGAVEEATAEAAKHGDRSEPLAALVAEARAMLERARAAEAERARAAAEAAKAAAVAKAAAAAEAAAERLRMEEEMEALTLRVQRDVLRLQQMRARVGSGAVPQAAAHLDAEASECVVCMDAPKDRIVLPCMHVCACEACAQRLVELDASCPVCRGPVERMAQVFF
jgi:hypothetical protein